MALLCKRVGRHNAKDFRILARNQEWEQEWEQLHLHSGVFLDSNIIYEVRGKQCSSKTNATQCKYVDEAEMGTSRKKIQKYKKQSFVNWLNVLHTEKTIYDIHNLKSG